MDLLVRASLRLRSLARRGHGVIAGAALAGWVIAGGATAEPTPTGLLIVAAWLLLLGVRLRRKARPVGEASALLDFEIGALAAVGLDAILLRVDGGLSGRWSAGVYALVALVAATATPGAGVAVVCWVLGLEAALRYWTTHEADSRAFAIRVCFVAAFALMNLTLLRAELARMRATAHAHVDAQLARIREDARSYRLLGAGESGDPEEVRNARLTRASVEEIHLSVHYALDLLRRSLGLHTAVLLWLNDAGTHLRVSALSTTSDAISDAPFPAGDGVLGAVLAKRAIVTLRGLRPTFKVPYYAGPSPARVLAAVPVLEGETLRGVLAIDRSEDNAFSSDDEDMAAQAARFCLRAIQNERVFLQLERAKVEQGKLYRAAQALGSALSEKDVVAAGVKAAREVASFDAAAVTVFDEQAKTHEVVAVDGAGGTLDDLVGIRFSHNAGLVSMVVQNRCPLPYRGEHEGAQKVVLSKRVPWPQHPSLLVLPLVLHDRALGTLILGAKRRHAFGDSVRPTLEVLASHLAVSLSNARMVRKLETMATTDGLTSLLNKRAMLDSGAQKIAAAARFGRRLALLIVDIDHFKRVNDTYGHDVGDLVIRGLGDVLKRQKRTTDVVARFGGEEFVVLCEQTDEKGAMLLAERIRDELGKTIFRAPRGALSVTCSIGIAIFPESGSDWDSLFRAADEALYVSKRSGRNRCTTARPRKAASALA
jgi:diguanylate cyclase (GGDEF)-like protein